MFKLSEHITADLIESHYLSEQVHIHEPFDFEGSNDGKLSEARGRSEHVHESFDFFGVDATSDDEDDDDDDDEETSAESQSAYQTRAARIRESLRPVTWRWVESSKSARTRYGIAEA